MLSLGLNVWSAALYGRRFSPLSISGLGLWLDANDESTISIATGVSQWNDKSGNNNHASQATGAKQPTVAAAALNGRNTLAFASAAQQALTLASPISAVGATDTWTLFSVVKRSVSLALVSPIGSDDGAGSANFSLLLSSDSRLYAASSVKTTNSTAATYNDTSYHRIATTHTASDTFNLYHDGAQITDSEGAGARRTNWGVVGAALGASDFYTNGNIAELIYYNRVLSADEITQIHAYLLAKWGV